MPGDTFARLFQYRTFMTRVYYVPSLNHIAGLGLVPVESITPNAHDLGNVRRRNFVPLLSLLRSHNKPQMYRRIGGCIDTVYP